VSKSHFACENRTLRVELTLERVEITLMRVKITLERMNFTRKRVIFTRLRVRFLRCVRVGSTRNLLLCRCLYIIDPQIDIPSSPCSNSF
jgi:hypothetical protein